MSSFSDNSHSAAAEAEAAISAAPAPADTYIAAEEASLSRASAAAVDNDADDPSAVAHQSDFECALCCCLLLDPVTTDGCGHTFCRQCLLSSLAVKRFCPLCRHPCPELDALSHPTAQLLATLAQRYWPEEYAARKASALAEGQAFQRTAAASARFGIFLSTTPLFPLAPLSLHIYEPRYRVMISRALASTTRTFIVLCVTDQQRAQPAAQQPQPAVAAVGEAELAADGEERKEGPPPAAAAAAAAAAVDIGVAAREGVVGVAGERPGPRLAPLGAAHVLDPLRFHPPPFDPLRAGGGPLELAALLRGADVREGDVGCLVRIGNARAMPDGRSFVECRGVGRVRIKQLRPEDEQAFGLLSAEVTNIEDEQPEPQAQPVLQQQSDEQEDAQPRDDNGLRQRRPAASAAGDAAPLFGAAAAAASASADALPLPVAAPAAAAAVVDPVPDLVVECHRLLAEYCQLNGLSVGRLSAMFGGWACPPAERAAELAWWLLSVLPEHAANATPIKMEALASTSLQTRLALCVELLHASIDLSQQRTKTQSMIIAVLAALAVFMLVAKQWQLV